MSDRVNKKQIDDSLYNYTVQRASHIFEIPKIRALHQNDIMNNKALDLHKASTDSTWHPTFRTCGRLFESPSARYSIKEFWHKVRRGAKISPEFRDPYEYPTMMVVGEAQFTIPLIRAFKGDNLSIMAHGLYMAPGGDMHVRHDLNQHEYHAWFQFKDFNKMMSQQLIEDTFLTLLDKFDLSSYDPCGAPNTERLMKQYNYIMKYFVYNYQRVLNGSLFVKLVHVIVSWILVNYAFLKAFSRFPTYVRVFADCSVIADKRSFSPPKFCEVMYQETGMMIAHRKNVIYVHKPQENRSQFVIQS